MMANSKINRKRKVRSRRSDINPGKTPPSYFVNRELSWLEFNRRVLAQASDEGLPLLERLRFISIFTSNLDEFYMKRVGGLKQQIVAGIAHTTADGMSPLQELQAIRSTVINLLAEQGQIYEQQLLPALGKSGILLLKWGELNEADRAFVRSYYKAKVFPILTPLSVDPGHPFPYLSNLSTSLGITLRHPDKLDERLFARVKVPPILPQWIRIESKESGSEHRFVNLREVILHNLAELFPGMEILNAMSFRVTRNAEVELDELDAEDLLDHIKSELRQRRFAKVVRLEHSRGADPWILSLLREELELGSDDLYEMPSKLDYTALKPIFELNIPHLKFDPWVPAQTAKLSDEDSNIFSTIKQRDYLLHHPYESFASSVERFIKCAAEDPKVVAIKMTLYRTGEQSSIVPLLMKAAEQGKQVVCVIELKAHFDEARNIAWAQAMEKAGVHVIYGLVGLKTHAKCILVMRDESDGIQCYAHIGTGNYHPQNAGVYTDLGLLTTRADITSELVEVFNFLTGRSLKRDYSTLIVAPFDMKQRFLALIYRELECAKAGKPARILAKMNSLEDHGIISALYQASQAGVKVDLIVRGLCCLRPGIAGVSENIQVISIVGRLLEHSRAFYFQNGATDPLDGEFLIGSADWMYRNMLSRVEIVTPILDRALRERCFEALNSGLSDVTQGWRMQSDGTYRRLTRADVANPLAISSQQFLMQESKERFQRYQQNTAAARSISTSESDLSKVS
jgi:polyphosphate kinase